ncbi:MAG: Trk system potassium transporter TrkA [Bacteroidetes bacterium]|nr:MAG: Trk system potassium transporter TrkA [Bacteroidota bacterium]
MNIVIAGAGDMGFHLAELLVSENQAITLIDNNPDVLDYAAAHLDVLTLQGDASSIHILEKAEVGKAQLFLAVTTFETTNLVASILAKKMGARQTVARVSNTEFLEESQRQTFRELGVDSLISPRMLAAREIVRLVKQGTFTDVFEFEKGKVTLVGVTLPDYSPLVNKKVQDLNGPFLQNDILPIAVLRGVRTHIVKGDFVFRPKDHVYFLSKNEFLPRIEAHIGAHKVQIENIMIIGGTGMAYETARMLEQDYHVTLIERDKDRCKLLAEHLDRTLVIHGPTDSVDLMREEGLEHMQAFIALTPNSETNIIACLTAKNYGVYKTIAQVENKEYTHISQNIGVDTLINKKLIAANNVFRFVRKGKIEAITSLHGVDAEIIEFLVHKNNQLTRKPLKHLPFPEQAVVAGIIRGEESIIPDGEFQLQVGDKVIVFAMPQAIGKLEQLFR